MGTYAFMIYMLLVISTCINSVSSTSTSAATSTTNSSSSAGSIDTSAATSPTGNSSSVGSTDSSSATSSTDSSSSVGATDSSTATGSTDSSTATGSTDSSAATGSTASSSSVDATASSATTDSTDTSAATGSTASSSSVGATASSSPTGSTDSSAATGTTDSSAGTGSTDNSAPTSATDSSTATSSPDSSPVTGSTDSSAATGSSDSSAPTDSTGSTASTHSTDSTVSGSLASSSPYSTSTLPPTTQAPPATTAYPVKKPSLDGATYELRFIITVKAELHLAVNLIGALSMEFEKAFGTVEGYFKVTILPVLKNTRRRKRDTPSTDMTCNMEFNATDVHTTNETAAGHLGQKLKDAMNSIPPKIDGVQWEKDPKFESLVDDFTKTLQDPCKAAGSGVCSFNQICERDLCYHRCEFLNCGEHGECRVVGIDENSIQAQCQCSSDNLYDYSGDTCQTKVMNWMYILVITCSIGGGIILVLSVAVICCCLRRRKGPKTDQSLLDGYSEGGHDISLQDFSQRRSLINPRFKTGYTDMAHRNEGYQPDAYDPCFYQSENRSWLHSAEAQSAMEKQRRAEKGFQSGFHSIDSERSFSIKRPQVSPRAVGDEQL